MNQDLCDFSELEGLTAKKNKNFDNLFLIKCNNVSVKPNVKYSNDSKIIKKKLDIKNYENKHLISIWKESSILNPNKKIKNRKKISFFISENWTNSKVSY